MALTTFRSKRTQLWQYLNTTVDFFLRSVGLKNSDSFEFGVTTNPVSLKKDDLQTYTLGSTEYDVYKFKGWTVLNGSNIYIVDMGLINVSTGPMLIISNKSNIAADDTAGVGGFTNGAIANTGTLVEDNGTSIAQLATLFYVNQDNTLTGVDDNYMFLVAANTGLVSFEAEAYVDIEFIVEKGATVTLTTF